MSNIKEILDTEQGAELKTLLLEEYQKLNDIRSIKDCKDPIAQAVEVKAQKKATKALRDILKKIVNIPNERNIEKEQYYNLP